MSTQLTEVLAFYLWHKPILGRVVPPWEERRRALVAARQAALAERRLFQEDAPADDCEPVEGNRYRHYHPHRDDLFDIRAMLAEVDRDMFGGLFAEHDILPEIDWWWRGAKGDSRSTTAGMAFLCESRILIHFRFSSVDCPEEALRLLIYHELLHHALCRAGLPHGHSIAFHTLEAEFPNFGRANRSLDTFMDDHIIGECIGKRKPTRRLHDLDRADNSHPHNPAFRAFLRRKLRLAA